MAAAGIGCHTLSILMDRNTSGVTQMGGEGANWVGASLFSDIDHIFQNIGDGTLAHSGSLAIRQACAAGTHMTFKILYNSAVAMTGGQQADGLMPVPELTHLLYAEGVTKTIVVSADPGRFPAEANWAPQAEVWERDRMDEAQLLLRDTPGVTVLVYDQECAANLRRKAQARLRGRSEPAHLHQRSGLRGLRRLRIGLQLPERAAGRHRIRPQDADSSVLLQQGLHLPGGQLSGIRQRGSHRKGARRRPSRPSQSSAKSPSRGSAWKTRPTSC